MAKLLKADTSAGDAYATVNLSPGSATSFWLQHRFYIPQATLTAISSVGSPDWVTADLWQQAEGFFADSTDGSTWLYWTDNSPDPPAGALTADAWHTLVVQVAHVSAGLWHLTWKVDGSTVQSYDLAVSDGYWTGQNYHFGGLGGAHVAGEVYYLDDIKVGTAEGLADIFDADFEGGTFAGFGSETGSVSIVDNPFTTPAWTFLLSDILTDATLCDLTNAATATLSVRLNRPLALTLSLAGDNACCNTVNGDGDLNLCVGTRSIKAYQEGVLRANTPIENIEWSGDENASTVSVTCYDPMQRFLTRTVYDSDGSFVKPSFATPISGGDLIKQMVDNSVSNAGTSDDSVFDAITPAVFPIETSTGTFDTTIPPAIDLSFDVPDGPSTIADVMTLLTETGAVDVVLNPLDTNLGAAAGVLGQLNAVNKAGTDLTATVHFDYFTGDKNVAKCRRVSDMGTVSNKVIYELGPPAMSDGQHWKGNITATELTPVDLSAFLTLEMASRLKYGTRTRISIYDSNGDENSARPLFHQLWETEVTTCVNPRNLLYLTPVAPSPFRPFVDFNLGDTVTVNVGTGLVGAAIGGETQRIFGFDVAIDTEGVERLGELVCSSDAE